MNEREIQIEPSRHIESEMKETGLTRETNKQFRRKKTLPETDEEIKTFLIINDRKLKIFRMETGIQTKIIIMVMSFDF